MPKVAIAFPPLTLVIAGAALCGIFFNFYAMNKMSDQHYWHLEHHVKENNVSSTPLASDWIRQSYDKTYKKLFSMWDCREEEQQKTCFKRMLDENNSSSLSSLPWWTSTLLRDSIRGIGLEGAWHYQASPDIRMCSIEKIGTTQWRKIFCALNNETHRPQSCYPPEYSADDMYKTSNPRFVFLRDPLERLLSAHIDKCYRGNLNTYYCKPTPIFHNASHSEHLKNIAHDKKLLFHAHVDALPLKWDVHFVPMSFYCDGLYRRIQKYDFVGHMGTNFYKDLSRLGDQFGDDMKVALEQVFSLKRKQSETKINCGTETAAAKHLQEYYTPASLRRALEYLSIDYIMLDLPIPEWAERMLAQDEGLDIQNDSGGNSNSDTQEC